MILLVDIGNSNIVFGLYDNKEIIDVKRIKTFTDKTSDEYFILIKGILDNINIADVIISSVVPLATTSIRKVFVDKFNIEPKILGMGTKTGINLKVDDPKSVGSDIICDVAGVVDTYEECLIIDLGTATKFIYTKNKTLLGLSISPGLSVSTKALVNSTALLPNVELVAPKKVLNNSTIPCMQSGIIYGFTSLLDGMIERIKEEINNPNLKVLATGGLAKLIVPLCKEDILLDDNLNLKGLAYIYEKNIN